VSSFKSASPIFLILFVGFCFSQTAPKTSKPQAKPAASQAAPSSTAKQPESKQTTDEVIPPADPNALFPSVVAKVNGKPVLGRELERMVRRELAGIGSPEWKNLREEYKTQLIYSFIQSLVSSELIYQKATAIGMKATDAEVQAELQKIAKSFKDDGEMNAALANEFIDRSMLEKDIGKRIAIDKYIAENITKKVPAVTPEDVEKYYSGHPDEFKHPELVRTSHILIQPAGDSAEQDALAKKRAEDLLARVNKGEDFAKLAKDNSMDASASQGGDIGFAPKDALAKEYGEAAFSLPVGGIKLTKTSYGYHIIKVTDKKKEGTASLEEVRSSLTDFLKNQKSDAELKKAIEQLRDQGKIEFLIPVGQPLVP
jgi:peptidyl-prolyl cis-trans isomerase C